MKIVYLVLAIFAIFELIGIRAALTTIAGAYVIWAKSLEQDANPLQVIDLDDDDGRPKGRPEAPL